MLFGHLCENMNWMDLMVSSRSTAWVFLTSAGLMARLMNDNAISLN